MYVIIYLSTLFSRWEMPKSNFMKPDKGKSFLYVRNYLATLLNKSLSEVNKDVANKIGRDAKSIEKYWNGEGSFSFGQAQSIVDLFLGEDYYEYDLKEGGKLKGKQKAMEYGAVKYDKAQILKPMLSYFLKLHDEENLGYENFLNKYFNSSTLIDETKVLKDKSGKNFNQNVRKTEFIKRDIHQKIKNAIKNKKFIFFSGNSGTGKKAMSEMIIDDYRNNHDLKKICIDSEIDEMTYSNFLKKILSHVTRDLQNLPLDKMERKAAEYLAKRKNIIFINGFDSFRNDTDRKNLIYFLKHDLSDENIVIITSNEAKAKYEYIEEPFLEVPDRDYTYDEWLILAEHLKNLKPYCDAIQICNNLYRYAYEKGRKIPGLMKYYLYEFSKQVVEEDLYDNFDLAANTFLFEKILKDLDDDCIFVLVTLSLFPNSISEERLIEISGIKETARMSKALDILKSKFLIKMNKTENAEAALYSLRNKIKNVIENEIQTNSAKYEAIFDRWIKFYIDITKTLNITHDNYEKLYKQQPELSCIGSVLAFCEESGRFSDFCTLYENFGYKYV